MSEIPHVPHVRNSLRSHRQRPRRRHREEACKTAGVPDLQFHDLRRTAVRNMRRAGVPQVMRMKISGHKTDSMERRYNITDAEDLAIARELMERRTVVDCSETVVDERNPEKPGDTAKLKNQQLKP